ncbi:MAG: DUF998 domain-containing protein [Candidatus Bathyarchaeota archaeon]|jgi:hypothetical membrane protein
MKYDNRKVAGMLLFIAGVQFLWGMVIAEALHPDYSVSENYISDLGVGATSLIFNSSVFLFGVMAVAGAYFIQRAFSERLLSTLFTLAGIGSMGVGLFPENTIPVVHAVAALMAFGFGGLSAIASHRLQRPPLSYASILLGVLSILALALFGSRIYLGLGVGGMERMIVYPTLLWAVGFGGHLIGYS